MTLTRSPLLVPLDKSSLSHFVDCRLSWSYHRRLMSRTRSPLDSGASSLAFSRVGRLLVNMRGANMYCFEAAARALAATPEFYSSAGSAAAMPEGPVDREREAGDDDDDEAVDEARQDLPHLTHEAAAPMDAAVESYERKERAWQTAGLRQIDGIPTLTRPVAEYTGRVNQQTFAKEARRVVGG